MRWSSRLVGSDAAGTNFLSVDQEILAYAILDVAAKAVFGAGAYSMNAGAALTRPSPPLLARRHCRGQRLAPVVVDRARRLEQRLRRHPHRGGLIELP